MEEGRTEEDMNQQQQRRRLKPPIQSENQPQQPQKCPRCDSLNTKFCYYNNYSLSQPRYFCKTCRRYWTQGGTLRNVPVGGGCRRGKRAKPSSSGGDNSRSQPSPPPPPPPPQQQLQVPQNLTNKEYGNFGLPANSYYSGGGFLSSLAAMQSLSRPQGGFNQPFNVAGGQFGGGGGSGGASNLGVAQGFNVPSFRSQESHPPQIQHQSEIYQMGNRDKNIEPLYPPDQTFVQPNRPVGSWTHSFINNNINGPPSSPSFWMNSSTSGSSMNPNQWPDLSPP